MKTLIFKSGCFVSVSCWARYVFTAICCLMMSQTSYAQNNDNTNFIDQDSAYYAQKQANYLNENIAGQSTIRKSVEANNSGVKSNLARTSSTNIGNRTAAESCIIPTDNTWSSLPGNDDGSTGVINLGFTFDFYGTAYTQVYINNNGNITFGAPFSAYIPSGFPSAQQMIAAFWDDVDTRTCGTVRYKLFGTRLVVSYESVGQFSLDCSKLNTFQIIIGTTNDPLIGLGQNVKFYYGDMQWTDDNVSSGGINTSTVGINKGNGVNYIQVGRFSDLNGSSYDGGGGAADGVDYLDYQCFSFNVSNDGNIPPSFSGFPPNNTLTLQVCQTANLTIQAIGPEVDQNVTTTINTNGLCGITPIISNGLVSTTTFSITGSACNVGTHTIEFTATDNGAPNETTIATLTLIIEGPKLTCPADITVNNDAGICGAVVNYTMPVANDNCGVCSTPTSIIDFTPLGNYNGHKYFISTNTVFWSAAKSAAISLGGHLVSINDVAERNFLTTATTQGAWIGFTDEAVEGTFVWVNGDPVTYTNWSGGEPNNAGDIEDYAIINWYLGAWNDLSNNYNLPYIIEFDCDGSTSDVTVAQTAGLASGEVFPVGTTTNTFEATDAAGNISSCSFDVVVVDNEAPTILADFLSKKCLWPPNHKMVDVYLSASDNCGSIASSSITITSNEPINDLGDGNTEPDWYTNVGGDPLHIQLRAERSGVQALNPYDIGRIYTITVNSLTDASGNMYTTPTTNTVTVAHNITAPNAGNSCKIGTNIGLAGTFWDVPGNKHTAKWLVDGASVNGTVIAEPSGNKVGKVTGSYNPTVAGVYKLQMNVTDQKGVTSYASTNGNFEAIVVAYDPSSKNYTYGGGKFMSPAGALKSNPTATGLVAFGFTSNYYKNSTFPKGETLLDFKVGDFTFSALNFDYLVVSGVKAQFKGLGKMTNGLVEQSGLAFILTVIDGQLTGGGGVDKIRMKIYNKKTNQVYYDNQSGSDADAPVTPVESGSTIVIGNAAGATIISTAKIAEVSKPEPSLFHVKAYPNPANHQFTLVMEGGSTEKIEVMVYDIFGRMVNHIEKSNGEPIQFGEKLPRGYYTAIVKQGSNQQMVKLIKQE